MSQLKLLKFDTIHPHDYLQQQKAAWGNINKLSRSEYLTKLIGLRSNFSDFYTYNLSPADWIGEEFIVNDPDYLKKVRQETSGINLVDRTLRKVLRRPANWLTIVENYLNSYQPQVIFSREHTNIPSEFWQRFRKNTLVISRLAAPLPRNWHPADFDGIYTSTPEFKSFFEAHGVHSVINENGFDERLLAEVGDVAKTKEVVFVGGLGMRCFKKRTVVMEQLSDQFKFEWWGYFDSGHSHEKLLAAFNGPTSGLDMYRIYKGANAVVNDYIDMANESGVNQRIFEVLGVGSFLLTREAENLKQAFPDGCFATFKNESDCIDKLKYFLKNDKEREEIAKNGQQFLLQNFSYKKLMGVLGQQLHEMYIAKFG